MPKKHCHTVPDEHKHRLELVNECLHNDLARLGEEQDRYRKVEALVNRRHQERLQRLLTEVFGVPAVPEGSLLTHNVEEHTVTVMLPEPDEPTERAAAPDHAADTASVATGSGLDSPSPTTTIEQAPDHGMAWVTPPTGVVQDQPA